MTVSEIDNEFLTLYDRVSHTSAPSLDAYERSVLLTKAQENVIKRKYHKLGNKYQQGFDATEKRMDDLDKLINYNEPTESVSQSGAHPDGTIYDLPLDYWLTIEETAVIDKNDCYTGLPIVADVKVRTHDQYAANVKNPFRSPYFNGYESEVWRLRTFTDSALSRHELITSSTFNVTTYKLRYLKYPTPIIVSTLEDGLSIDGQTQSVASTLSDGVHREIIDEAVRLATLVTNPAEIQLRQNELQMNE